MLGELKGMSRILVVEDEVVVGLALREDVRDRGGHVTVTHDAESALQQLALNRFDAAIIDVALPGMRGDELARQCRRRFPAMPVILATGWDESEIRAAFRSDRHCEIVEKPYDFHDMLSCLERLGLQFQPPNASLPRPY